MNTNRKTAVIVGVLFILAAVTSILAIVFYGPILTDPDYIIKGPTNGTQVVVGALFELMLAASAIGTSITLYPILKRRNETVALGYVCFRFFEAVLIVIGVVSLLSLLTLSQQFGSGVAADASAFRTVGKSLLAIHAWTFILGPNFMLGINTLMYSYLLYKTRLIPRPLVTLGLIGAGSVFIAALLEMFGLILQVSAAGALLSLPVAAYEMSLAVWLIVKGFNVSASLSGAAENEPNKLLAARQ